MCWSWHFDRPGQTVHIDWCASVLLLGAAVQWNVEAAEERLPIYQHLNYTTVAQDLVSLRKMAIVMLYLMVEAIPAVFIFCRAAREIMDDLWGVFLPQPLVEDRDTFHERKAFSSHLEPKNGICVWYNEGIYVLNYGFGKWISVYAI